MARYSAEDYEFEKNKQAILALAKSKDTNKADDKHQAVWEYEIIEHRKRQKREKFLVLGAWSGLISLMISCFLLFNCFFNVIR